LEIIAAWTVSANFRFDGLLDTLNRGRGFFPIRQQRRQTEAADDHGNSSQGEATQPYFRDGTQQSSASEAQETGNDCGAVIHGAKRSAI